MKYSNVIILLIGLIAFSGCAKNGKYHTANEIAQPEEKPKVRQPIYHGTSSASKVSLSLGGRKQEVRSQNSAAALKRSNYQQDVKNTFKFPVAVSPSSNDIALIIGIARYDSNPDVIFADNSAYAFKELLHQTIGIPKENILLLLNEQATSGKIKSRLALTKELAEKQGNLYFYFAGHGVPAKDGKTYLLPYDMSADEIHLEPNLKMDTIYKKLAASDAKHVYAVVDSCFSGKDDSGNLLYQGVAPVLKIKKNIVYNKKVTVISAGGPTDFANDYEKRKQRMFTYFFIQSIIDGDRQLDKLYEKTRKNVKHDSLRKGVGYKQVPQLQGNRQGTFF